MSREIVQTADAPKAIGTYSQAVKARGTIYLSGQIPLDPANGEMVGTDTRAQIVQVLENLAAVARAADASLADAVKLTVYLCDLGDFGLVNEVMAEYFTAPYPARAAVEVSALPRGARVEMDAVLVP